MYVGICMSIITTGIIITVIINNNNIIIIVYFRYDKLCFRYDKLCKAQYNTKIILFTAIISIKDI